ncbi:MAG: S24/S26 family peptidase [Desulfobacula sp.]|uniref:S24/S26 family peptidase n=1 Tax=Desulfobacula sp. TaxID=2593537 RepID=UPI0025C6B84D|nr:S24/S26 family peptidase [Desulfobacula sp.]MCD4720394.1 S24/S26 family peptidase [Desulfobacula sp.]
MKNKSPDTCSIVKDHGVLNLSSRSLGKLVKEFTQKRKKIKFKAKGHSMKPFIKEGDTITISPYIDLYPVPGDIVAYLNSVTDKLIIHRIMKISGNSFIAKGDNCFNNDIVHGINCIIGYVSQINGNSFIKKNLISSPFKRVLTAFSAIGLIFYLNKFLKKIECLIK